jgi:hypothetical protein
MPSRGVRDRSPPGLLASKADGAVRAVRRGGRTRKAPPGQRIGRRSRYSCMVRVKAVLLWLRAEGNIDGDLSGCGRILFDDVGGAFF